MRIGYLGPEGTFSEEAAFRYFRDSSVIRNMYRSIPDVVDSVEAGDNDFGIIPIENSIEGSVNVALDTLLQQHRLFVCGEYVLPIHQHLLGLPATTLDKVQEVWSIPPALAQCHAFIRAQKFTPRHFDSTASAAKALVDTQRTDAAAVASAWAAERFQLQVLASDIQDTHENQTRFLAVAGSNTVSEGADKTMLAVLPKTEASGVLASILQVFATLDLNLTWIVSRPTKTKLGIYQFILDVEAGIGDSRLQDALAILNIYGHQFRVIGSFACHKSE